MKALCGDIKEIDKSLGNNKFLRCSNCLGNNLYDYDGALGYESTYCGDCKNDVADLMYLIDERVIIKNFHKINRELCEVEQ